MLDSAAGLAAQRGKTVAISETAMPCQADFFKFLVRLWQTSPLDFRMACSRWSGGGLCWRATRWGIAGRRLMETMPGRPAVAPPP